ESPEPAEEAQGDEEPAPAVAVDRDTAGSVDPVRMYMRQMASVALLTREGEVEIARRIEAGEREMIRGVLGCPYALRRVLALGDRLRAGEVRLRDLVRDETDEEGEPVEDDETHRRRFLKQLATLRRLADECCGPAQPDGSTASTSWCSPSRFEPRRASCGRSSATPGCPPRRSSARSLPCTRRNGARAPPSRS